MAEAAVRALMALARAAKSVAALEPTVTEGAVLAALTSWFGSAAALSADTLPAELVELLVELGVSRRAAEAVGALATVARLSGRSKYGSPAPRDKMPVTRRVASEEPEMRARYVLAGGRRLTAAEDFERALLVERHYFDQHARAGRNRRRAARRVDEIAKEHLVMAWRTAGDDRVDPRCRALNGRLFTANHLPDGQIPGAVHPRCRCQPEPWGGVLTAPFFP